MASRAGLRYRRGNDAHRDDTMAKSGEFEKVTFAAGDFLFEESRTAESVYLITKGEVEIRAGTHGDSPRTITKIGKGEIVGEMALFDDHPRTAAAIALGDVEAIRISRPAFRARLGEMDPVMRSIVLMMVKRMRQMAIQIIELKMHDWRPIKS